MSKNFSPVISSKALYEERFSPNLILVDASGGATARANYEAKHLEGAFFVDLETQLADIKPDASIGGRHPLPLPAQFGFLLSNLGITPQSHIVVYDDKNGANAAARFWWMVRSTGHEYVQVLDGGMQSAVKIGFPVSDKIPNPNKVQPYPASDWLLPLVEIKEVEKLVQDPQYIVIDVRDEIRYKGITEPIDLIAGHIPGAINVPLTENLDEQGFFHSSEQLKAKYSEILEGKKTEQVVVHCGSGVTACHTILAFDHAGLEIPALYVGSWSEWSRNDLPIATQ